MKPSLLWIVPGLVLGLAAACGDDDDDDDGGGGPTLDATLDDLGADLESSIRRVQEFGCDCVHEVDPDYDCADIFAGAGDNLPSAADVSSCDREVFAEFKEETLAAATCIRAEFEQAADAAIDAGCEAFREGSGGGFGDIETQVDACTADVDGKVEAWVEDHGKQDCIGFYGED